MKFYSKSVILFLIITSSFFFVFQKHQKDEISNRKKELSGIKKQIEEIEKRIRESEKKERSTLELIDKYDRKNALLNSLINRLNDEIEIQQNDVASAESEINRAELRLNYLKLDYAKYVVSTYKRGRIRDLELIISANSLNQMYIRLEYLRRFSENRKKELARILAQKDTIEIYAVRLKEKLDDKILLLNDRTEEEKNLKKNIEQRKVTLKNIRKNKNVYYQELDRKNRAAKDLEKLINRLIAEETRKKESERASHPSADKISKTGFGIKKGKLIWPVNGKIVGHFGNQIHPTLKTITQNIGVDISVPEGTNVKAVASGEVSIIYFVAGYGNLLIINHYDGYRTVYAHLSQILVKEGQLIKEGQVIAKSGESISGPILNFQIWKNRDQQNPELWLAGR